MMGELLRVRVKDSKGNWFIKDWKKTVNKIDAVRWTLENPDLPYYVDIEKIIEINVE